MKNETINADTVAMRLGDYTQVSVPFLQELFDLDYKTARALAEELVRCNWLVPPEKGLSFSVVSEHVRGRRWEKEKINAVIPKLSRDDAAAIRLLSERFCASFEGLESAVQGNSDTEAAITHLTDFGLLYQHEDIFYAMADKETLLALDDGYRQSSSSQRTRGRSDAQRRFSADSEED